MADLTYPMAVQLALDEISTAAVSIETYLRAWDMKSDGRLAKSEDRLKDFPAGTPLEILRKADRQFSRLFYSVEKYTFFLQDAVNEIEKSPLTKEEKQIVYASLYETSKRLQNVVHDIRHGTEAEGGSADRYHAFFRHLDWAVSQELTAPAQRKFPLEYAMFGPRSERKENKIPVETRFGDVAEKIRGRTTAALIFTAMAQGSKRAVDYEYYSRKSREYEKMEPPELNFAGMRTSGAKTTFSLKTERPKSPSGIFKLTPTRVSGGTEEKTAVFAAGTQNAGPVIYDVIATGVEAYSGIDRMLKGTKIGRAVSILDQYFDLKLFEGKTPEERKRAYNDFLRAIGHSREFVTLVASIKTYRQNDDGKMVERLSASNDLRMNDIVGISQQLLANPQLAQLASDFKAKEEQKKNLVIAEQPQTQKRAVQAR